MIPFYVICICICSWISIYCICILLGWQVDNLLVDLHSIWICLERNFWVSARILSCAWSSWSPWSPLRQYHKRLHIKSKSAIDILIWHYQTVSPEIIIRHISSDIIIRQYHQRQHISNQSQHHRSLHLDWKFEGESPHDMPDICGEPNSSSSFSLNLAKSQKWHSWHENEF